MAKLVDLTGQKFTRLTVVSRDNTSTKSVRWNCVCDCGNTTNVAANELKRGSSRSCGCLQKELAAKRVSTHKLSKTPTYKVWDAIIQRCLNENSQAYANYGGRGITVCEHWKTFQNFYADMGEKPDGLSIDRIDNNKGYSPDNCRWADTKTQSTNKRTNNKYTYDHKTLCISEWAELYGMSHACLSMRLIRGWSIERALTTPVPRL